MPQANTLRRLKRAVKPALLPRVPSSISRRFIAIDQSALGVIERALREHYFSEPENCFGLSLEEYFASDAGKRDLQDHLLRRMDNIRRTIVPWLGAARTLDGAAVLEIGCGTGSATVALAEQGANVTGIDISEGKLAVAAERCRAYGLRADFRLANAAEAHRLFAGRRFDFILFFATLEHMTHEERMAAMKGTWEMLPAGGLWCIIDTPNRLWYLDVHTSLLPFYSWLPDRLAFEYARFSPRSGFQDSYRGRGDETELDFLRKGRGVSYHEFDLAMGGAERLKVVGSFPSFLRKRSPGLQLKWWLSRDRLYQAFLAGVGPKIHPGFYEPGLFLIIEKT